MQEIRKIYWENGVLCQQWTLLNGIEHGFKKGWYPNGVIRFINFRSFNRLQGLNQIWYYNKTRQYIRQWKDNFRLGPHIDFKY